MTPSLEISPELSLPLDAVTETFAILAKRRAGKSNAAVVMAEEMYDHGLPWVAIDPKGDWWGVRAAGDGQAPGLSVLVFGGLHGDVPLEPTAGRLVADLIVSQRLTCVLDVSEMSKADQRRFLIDFADRLYRTNAEPLHVFCEEADEYIPQRVMGENAKLVGVFETLVKRGGFRGIGTTLITQRSASLNKDVLTQIETLIPMRTPSPQDRKAILAWVDYHSSGAEAVAELPGLADGQAWVFSPQWLRTLTKIQFRRRRTFDSGATPKVGGKPKPPATLADVDLDAIKEAMADTIEKAKADDPKHLKAEVARLRRDLDAERAREIPTPEVERIEIPSLSDEVLARLTADVESLRGLADELLAGLAAVKHVPAPVSRREPPARVTAPRAARPAPVVVEGEVDLRKGARRMVEALGRMAPLRLSKSQWGMVSNMKTTSGTWSTYIGDIRRLGFLDESPAGFTLTEAGFDYLGGPPDPMTPEELQDHYRRILRAGASRMLDAVISAYPAGLTRDELGAAAEIATTSGTFSTYLGELTRNGLAERRDGEIVATEILMHGAQA